MSNSQKNAAKPKNIKKQSASHYIIFCCKKMKFVYPKAQKNVIFGKLSEEKLYLKAL